MRNNAYIGEITGSLFYGTGLYLFQSSPNPSIETLAVVAQVLGIYFLAISASVRVNSGNNSKSNGESSE